MTHTTSPTGADHTPVDTAGVYEHRKLNFKSLDDLLAEVRRIADAERGAQLRRLGNWSPGQAFGHLAGWINFAFDGYPMRTPFMVRLFGRFMKARMLDGPMPLGYRFPGVQAGTYATEDLPLEVGVDRIARAVERLRDNAPPLPNPLLGKLSHEQWITLHLRHAEGHLGFFSPRRD